MKMAKPAASTQPRADPVAERARRQQQGGKGDRIGVDHPLQAGKRGMKRRAHRRQRDIDDGDVKLDQQEAETGRCDREDEPGVDGDGPFHGQG
jgi:hypothetical protein